MVRVHVVSVHRLCLMRVFSVCAATPLLSVRTDSLSEVDCEQAFF